MARLTAIVLLMLLAATAGTVVTDAGAAIVPGRQQAGRRSRFLLASNSPAATTASPYACKKVCKHDRSACCGGRCVDLLADKHNCGACGIRCNKKCSNGFCDYAV